MSDKTAPGTVAVPDGWKLVPVQPTQAMCQEGQWKAREWPTFPLRISPIYQAMIEAAPSHPETAEGWSGWACQKPGRLPRLYGAREIAEVNLDDEETGDRLIFVKEVPHG